MKERNIDFIFATVMIAIHFLQIFGLLYNKKINFPFRDDLYDTISGLCNIVRIFPLVDEESYGGLYYWIMAFCLIFVLIVYFLMLVYIDYSIKIDKFYFTLPIKLLRYASSFIYWILMMPIIEIFISIFSCNSDTGTHAIDTSLACWSGIHIFYCILFSLSLMAYFVIFFLISFFYNESRPYHTDAFARLDTSFETYVTLYKIIITIIGHFLY